MKDNSLKNNSSRTPETNAGANMAYAKWRCEVVNSGKYSPVEISNEEVGKAITEAREFRCMTRTQVAGILGIPRLLCYCIIVYKW